MNDLVKTFLEKEKSKDWFINDLRLNLEWKDSKYLEMINLVNSILLEFKESYLIPKDLIYFFSFEIDRIIGITKHPSFFDLNLSSIKTDVDRENYKNLVEKRIAELENMRDEFLYGEI
ncbi:hypothetical protein [Flavobacterium columnare]|uniref:hypothetical protein n=1 Tax=Flavobacterium columnare TaxID=996 RepID=UPI000D1B32DE|nr:hypothetical protein [Flavobacterium columnare]MEB3801515.1 hypothetical protein [Flavobacterium columnare]MEB3801516.1 hypothetical protein [Flavobacterium columnare]PTD14129.1 hypothetical protein C6N29_06635 [Flavobacterium columnare]